MEPTSTNGRVRERETQPGSDSRPKEIDQPARRVVDGDDGVQVAGNAGGDGDLHQRSVEQDEPEVQVRVQTTGNLDVQGSAADCGHGSRRGGPLGKSVSA